MKLEAILKVEGDRAQLLHLQQLIIEWYREGAVEADLEMLQQQHPALKITINLGYWKAAINAVYVAVTDFDNAYRFVLVEDLPPYARLKRSGFGCIFSQISNFPAWFEGALNDVSNWHHIGTPFQAFIKHNDIKELPLNFSDANKHELITRLLTKDVVVEHTSCMTLPTSDQLERDDRAKTHVPAWVAWNETPTTIQKYNDAYIIWIER